MKTMWKLTSAILSLSVLTAAVPFSASAAEDDETAPEVMTATVQLNDTTASATGDNVKVEGNIITISASGSYEFKGTLKDGQICVNVPDKKADAETVKIFFNGVTLTGAAGPALYVMNAKNTSLNLVEGTENFLYDGETAYSAETNAVIYTKDDFTIKGEGSLRVEASNNHGIQSSEDLKVTGGKLKVKTTAEKVEGAERYADGLRGKDSVQIKGGSIDINANGDGIKSTKGSVAISGGEIEVKASNDAIQAETALSISGGTLKANGDRSLKLDKTDGAIAITGGTVLATATDEQPAAVNATQPVIELNFTEEQVKDQELAISKDTETIFAMTPDKKFSYVLISSPELATETAYELTLGGKLVLGNGMEAVKITAESGVTLIENVTVSAPDAFNGDIDQDGKIGISDAILLCRYIAEDPDATVKPEGVALMDFNKDGYVTSEDSQILLCYLAGVI